MHEASHISELAQESVLMLKILLDADTSDQLDPRWTHGSQSLVFGDFFFRLSNEGDPLRGYTMLVIQEIMAQEQDGIREEASECHKPSANEFQRYKAGQRNDHKGKKKREGKKN